MTENVIQPTPAEMGERIKPESKVGLSLSLCVLDVLQGQMPEEAISMIYSSTKVETPEELDELIKRYRKEFWSENPDEAEAICRRLFESGKVKQPRTTKGGGHHSVAEGYWLETDEFDAWKRQHG